MPLEAGQVRETVLVGAEEVLEVLVEVLVAVVAAAPEVRGVDEEEEDEVEEEDVKNALSGCQPVSSLSLNVLRASCKAQGFKIET